MSFFIDRSNQSKRLLSSSTHTILNAISTCINLESRSCHLCHLPMLYLCECSCWHSDTMATQCVDGCHSQHPAWSLGVKFRILSHDVRLFLRYTKHFILNSFLYLKYRLLLALFPGPAQLSIACCTGPAQLSVACCTASDGKLGGACTASDGKLGRAWEQG